MPTARGPARRSTSAAIARPTAEAVRRRTHLILVSGPPCSGKSTYVTEHKQPGDLVIDYDAIAQALGSANTHDHPDALHPFVLRAVDALLDRLGRAVPGQRAWLVKCMPSAGERLMARQHVVMDTSEAECMRRASEAGRPDTWQALIRDWFSTMPR